MSKGIRDNKIKMIDIDQINILNPRTRAQKTFFDIATNITKVGLKRPITVTPCKSKPPGKQYDLVCGQGRIETFIACGQKTIPALIIDASEEQALIMSLVENLARRKHRGTELMQAVEVLRKQGYDTATIAAKTGMRLEYVQGISNLIEKGEERLIAAVEAGQMPITLAINIATSPDDEQRALQEAYEAKELRGNKFLQTKRLLATRRRWGKGFGSQGSRKRDADADKKPSARSVHQVYKKEVDRKKLLARKANRASHTLLFVKHTMQELLSDAAFRKLLQTEDLLTLPKPLADLLTEKEGRHG